MSELIAEARVLVTPDTTTFRSLLTAQLAQATKGVTVPVSVTPVVSKTAASAQSAQMAGAQAASKAAAQLTSSSNAAAAAQAKLGQAADVVATAEKRAAIATTETVAANIRYAAAIRATTITFAAYEEALTTSDFQLKKQTRDAYGAAKANEALALSNLQVAQSGRASAAEDAARARGLANLSKGASSAGLSFLGLRGATLAAGGAFLAGAAGVVALGKALGDTAKFETSLNVFAATTGATADQMERISDVAKQLGADLTLPGVNANDAADALSGLSRAGLSVEESISGVRGVLQLATAAAIDNTDAVNIVASALNAYSLAGEEAGRVADLLAASSKESQGEITDVGLALQQSAAAAAQAGVSVEDTIALLTELGRAGLRGSDAGTSLRVALLRLIAPTKQAKEALDGLGVAIRDEAGNVRPEAFAEITEALQGFTKAQQDATLALIFGQDAFRAASIIGRDGAVGLREMRDATQEAGVAAQLAAARTKGLAGSAENLKNQFQTLGLEIGGALSGPLTTFVDSIARDVGAVNSLVGFIKGIGDEAPRAEQSLDELADAFHKLNEEGTRQEAVERVKDLGKNAAAAILTYQDLIAEIQDTQREIERLNEEGREDITGRLEDKLKRLNEQLTDTQSEGLKATDVMEGFRGTLELTAGAAEGLKNRIDEAFDRFAHPPKEPELVTPRRKRVSTLEGQADIAASEGELRQEERIRQQILARAIAAEKAGIHKDVEARQKLFDARVQAQTSLNNVERQIADKQKADRERLQKEREKDAKEALQARTQSFLTAQEDARTAQERLISRADETPGLRDDIQRQAQLRDLITRQIAAIKKSAIDEKAKQDALRDLRNARNQTIDQIRQLKATDKKQRQEQAEQAAEALASARLELAQTTFDLTGEKAPLERALDAEIKRQIAIKNAAKKGSLAFIQAQIEIRKLLKQRKDLNEEVDKSERNQGFSPFDFFQKQQGFAANLLGNIIPGFATSGLVGNQQPITDPRSAIVSETVPFGNELDRGVRPVQVDTTNALLRQILNTLKGTNPNPPEINQNRRMNQALLDTL